MKNESEDPKKPEAAPFDQAAFLADEYRNKKDCVWTKHLQADTIDAKKVTLSSPDSKHTIVASVSNYGTGVWVQSGDNQESIGLIVQNGVGPYLAIRAKEDKGLPALAITPDAIQIPEADGNTPILISIKDLIAAVRSLKSKPEGV